MTKVVELSRREGESKHLDDPISPKYGLPKTNQALPGFRL